MAGKDFETWWNSLSKVTRYSLLFSLFLTTIVHFGVISPYFLILTPDALWRLQIWRFVTAAFFFGGFSFSWLMAMLMLSTYMKYHEESDFKGKDADYFYMLFLLIIFISIMGLCMGLVITSFSLLLALCWIFCKRNTAHVMSFYGFEFKATIFPWVLIAFNIILLGQGLMESLVGVLAGHIYIFLKEILPQSHGMDWSITPQWVYFLWGTTPRVNIQRIHPEIHPVDSRAPWKSSWQRMGSWGRGRTLGSS